MWNEGSASTQRTSRCAWRQEANSVRAASRVARRPAALTAVVAGLALALGGAGCAARPAAPRGLNVLLVTLDTTRADALGCYWSPATSTPNLDRLASEGARFDRATACTPLTFPSHCTILTGTWPLVHGMRANASVSLGDQAVTVAELVSEAGYRSRAVVSAFVLKRMFGLAQGFELYNDSMPLAAPNRAALERTADLTANAAIANLTELAPARFFLWVHFYDPHYPYRSRSGHPDDSREAYAEEVAFVDLQLGRVLQALDRLGLADATAVVVVGDHGEGLGDHGESEHGYLLYETTQRVPLLIRCPGVVPAGKVVETRVRTVDVAPTLLELAGLERRPEMQGESLIKLATTIGPHPDRTAYGESWEASSALAMAPLLSLHLGDWKLVDGARPRLYALAADPAEKRDLAEVDPSRVAAMRRALRDLTATSRLDDGAAATVDDDTADALAALGYVAGSGRGSAPDSGTGALGAADDPYEQIETIERFSAAMRDFGADPGSAEALLREVIRRRPEAPTPFSYLIRLLRRSKREDEAAGFFREILVERPDARMPRLQLARLDLEKGRVDEGIGELELLLLREPDDVEVLLEIGRARRNAGELDRARGHLERARELEPRSPRPLIELALVASAAGDVAAAQALLGQAQTLDPSSVEIQRELARLRQADAAP
jgi:arylsulfatase A-like enzyme/Flp pilus assembly protein TadD